MPPVSILSIEPKPGRLHEVTYEYEIRCSDDECATGTSFTIAVDLTGADSGITLADDALATGIDSHTVVCNELSGCVMSGTRSFPAASDTLDEDYGRDEIRIDLQVTNLTTSATATVSSGEFPGNF